jgi:(2Fe-2S) ferredoxin
MAALPGRPRFFPTRGHLLVCVGPRCAERGAEALFDEVWRAFERCGLAYYMRGGSVRLTSSGCLGACSYGPNAACYRQDPERPGLEEAWYAGAQLSRLLEIGRAVQAGAPFPRPGRFDPGAPSEGTPDTGDDSTEEEGEGRDAARGR